MMRDADMYLTPASGCEVSSSKFLACEDILVDDLAYFERKF